MVYVVFDVQVNEVHKQSMHYSNITKQILLQCRVVSMCKQWSSEIKQVPSSSLELDLTLDLTTVEQALRDLHFEELKGLLRDTLLNVVVVLVIGAFEFKK